ncbi:hypothetical protein L9F63_021688, partial [Diploptera punctata]
IYSRDFVHVFDTKITEVVLSLRILGNSLPILRKRQHSCMTGVPVFVCYEGRGGLCSIRLSVPLLKLRPRKDLVETLLHEMIHAYLFVTHNNRDRDGHGPEFHKHMYRINKEAGTNITVYHSFHDEVKLYKQHWWRCNGVCQKLPPFYGMVKRSMNRAPGPSDTWWNDHQQRCGGSFIKVKEPEGFSGKKGKQANKNGVGGDALEEKVHQTGKIFATNFGIISDDSRYPSCSQGSSSKMSDIRNFFGNENGNKVINESVSFVNGTKINNATSSHNNWLLGGMLANKGSGTFVVTSKTNKPSGSVEQNTASNFIPFSGKGNKLGTSENVNKPHATMKRQSSTNEEVVNMKRSNNIVDVTASPSSSTTVKCPVCGDTVSEAVINSHLDACIETSETDNATCSGTDLNSHIKCPACNKNILQNELYSHLEICLGSIFGNTNTNEDDNLDEEAEYQCPSCASLHKHSDMNSHLDQCLG